MAGKRLKHPALQGLKIGQESNVTLDQIKEQQRLKKLTKKRKKGK